MFVSFVSVSDLGSYSILIYSYIYIYIRGRFIFEITNFIDGFFFNIYIDIYYLLKLIDNKLSFCDFEFDI